RTNRRLEQAVRSSGIELLKREPCRNSEELVPAYEYVSRKTSPFLHPAETEIMRNASFSQPWVLAGAAGGELCYLLLRNDLLTRSVSVEAAAGRPHRIGGTLALCCERPDR
ncbi:MAG: hypothetical protein ACC645_23720, partial [Pirellulales bacterium]